jgi:hypothetical protein
MPYKLRNKTVIVCGETLTVFEASNFMDVKRSMLMTEADQKWNGRKDLGIEEKAQRYLEAFLYPSLVACTEGNVPTLDEFTHNVPASDSDAWIDDVRELNARWFASIDLQTPEEQTAELEKKDESQTSSSPD